MVVQEPLEAVVAASEADSTVAEAEVDSVEASKTVADSVGEEEAESVSKEPEVSLPEEDSVVETVVVMQVLTAMPLPTPQLAQEPLEAVSVEVPTAEVVVMEDPALQTAPALQHYPVVGMIRAAADAHMTTETAVIVAAAIAATEIVMVPVVLEVVATWSR